MHTLFSVYAPELSYKLFSDVKKVNLVFLIYVPTIVWSALDSTQLSYTIEQDR